MNEIFEQSQKTQASINGAKKNIENNVIWKYAQKLHLYTLKNAFFVEY